MHVDVDSSKESVSQEPDTIAIVSQMLEQSPECETTALTSVDVQLGEALAEADEEVEDEISEDEIVEDDVADEEELENTPTEDDIDKDELEEDISTEEDDAGEDEDAWLEDENEDEADPGTEEVMIEDGAPEVLNCVRLLCSHLDSEGLKLKELIAVALLLLILEW